MTNAYTSYLEYARQYLHVYYVIFACNMSVMIEINIWREKNPYNY